MTSTQFHNPVLHGFYPDPSICSVGRDFYLVNSTFSYFPGIPIFHSQDLAHWEQIGNALTDNLQVNLLGNDDHEGIYAPSIRYYQGTYYIIADHETQKNHAGMFIITAKDPRGPWSKPTFIKGADGIDPSLFFDNGKCYFVVTHDNSEGSKYFGDNEIYLAEIDLETKQFISKKKPLWRGALRNVTWPEGPHLYKHGNYYYLLIAESGTESHHAMTIARSQSIAGPYEGNPNNPIMTHRFLGENYPVQNVGHGDFVKSFDGNWYFVCLGSRKFKGYVNTGRETFIGRVVWEDDWPVLNPGVGKLEESGVIDLPKKEMVKPSSVIDFDQDKFDLRCLFLRNPKKQNYIPQKDGSITLLGSKNELSGTESPTFLGIRESSVNSYFSIQMGKADLEGGQFGIAVYQNRTHFITFMLKAVHQYFELVVQKNVDGVVSVIASKQLQVMPRGLIVRQKGDQLMVGIFSEKDGQYEWLQQRVNTQFLSTEVAGGFVGCVVGTYFPNENNLGKVQVTKIETDNCY